MTGKYFTQKVKELDTLLLDYEKCFDFYHVSKPNKACGLEDACLLELQKQCKAAKKRSLIFGDADPKLLDPLFDDNIPPLPSMFFSIISLFRELTDWEKLDDSLFKGNWSGHRQYRNLFAYYPTNYKSSFVRLGKFIKEQLLDNFFDKVSIFHHPDLYILAEEHKNPFKREIETALAVLYTKLEKAAIEEENDLQQPIDEQNKSKLTAAQWVEQLAEEISEAELNGFGGNKTRYFESLSNKHNIGLSGSTLEKAWNARNKKMRVRR